MKITVYLGTGGVGKTSVAAASALAQARAGMKSLVLTIDPALRLRSALNLKGGLNEQTVPLDPPARGELWAEGSVQMGSPSATQPGTTLPSPAMCWP